LGKGWYEYLAKGMIDAKENSMGDLNGEKRFSFVHILGYRNKEIFFNHGVTIFRNKIG